MIVSGTDAQGNEVSQEFNVVRFGVKWGKGENDKIHVTGLGAGKYELQWDPNYGTHSFAGETGGWRVKGQPVYLIHDGADPNEGGPDYRSASNGCVELLGVNGFTKFNDYLILISGATGASKNEQLNQISQSNIITYIVKYATEPPLKVARKGPGITN